MITLTLQLCTEMVSHVLPCRHNLSRDSPAKMAVLTIMSYHARDLHDLQCVKKKLLQFKHGQDGRLDHAGLPWERMVWLALKCRVKIIGPRLSPQPGCRIKQNRGTNHIAMGNE